eukprot:jgi/Orpsp1_1/1176528/evm.model.c7180000057946.1
MVNAMKRKLIKSIQENSNEGKNIVLNKLVELFKIYDSYNADLTKLDNSKVKNFENELVDMAATLEYYNEVFFNSSI